MKQMKTMATTDRTEKLVDWLKSIFDKAFDLTVLAGDASARRYFRVQPIGCDDTYVVMDAPPPEIPDVFVKIGAALADVGVNVPRVLAADFDQGFLLLSDFGDRLYLKALNETSAHGLYEAAFLALAKIQSCAMDLPVFDRDFFDRQMGLFEEWYLKKHCGVMLSSEQKTLLMPVYDFLFDILNAQPVVFVHRDYHSRNLMITDNDSPGVLDFQDAMKGPVTYDLVSLLQDCYIAWPRHQVEAWVRHFNQFHPTIQPDLFLRWFDLTGVQRHLKNLGIFARLHHRDQKSHYLNDIPQVLEYLAAAMDRYSELKPLQHFFEALKKPVEVL